MFLGWSHRVHRNLQRSLAVVGLDITPGWSVGWWFVPFANFVKPKHAMNQAWLGSSPDEPPGSTSWKRRRPTPLLSFWWAAFLITGFVGQLAVRMTSADADLETFRSGIQASIASSAIGILAAVVAIAVVRSVTERHVRRAELLGIVDS